MKQKHFLRAVTALCLCLMLAACGTQTNESTTAAPASETAVTAASTSEAATALATTEYPTTICPTTAFPTTETVPEEVLPITILYTNDVHSYIHNTATGSDGKEQLLLTYSSIAAMKNELAGQGNSVLLVDAGDHVHGTLYGAYDEGETIIRLMNAAGYDAATLGNHEFDYGTFTMFRNIDRAEFPYLSATFFDLVTDKAVLPAYQVFEAGGRKVAFVGISSPDTIASSTPTYFMNEKGEYIYGFCAEDEGKTFFAEVQKAIDAARAEADYVIALGHLGNEEFSAPYTSLNTIKNTHGLDAFIDGHAHDTVEGERVTDASGKEVLLTQTGCYLAAVGQLTIAPDGTLSSTLITEYDKRDAEVEAIETAYLADIEKTMGEVIAENECFGYIMNPENPEERIIRRLETNLGDLTADAVYYYFNVANDIGCDVTIMNGGGIRASMETGEVSLLTAKAINPFGNVICLIEVSGQDLLNALEFSNVAIGMMNEKDNAPAEFGGFLQVAGIRFEVDASVPSTVSYDSNQMFIAGPTGDYRVKNVEIYNRESGSYEALDLNRTYRLGGINYILRNDGNGYTMFSASPLIVDFVGEDYMIFAEYLKAFAKGEDGLPHITSAGSPLAALDGYGLDYENPFGAGRITMK